MNSLTMQFSRTAAVPQPAERESSLDDLVRRLQNGDDTAVEPFVEATQRLAFKLAWQMLRDYHAAQDAVQEAYVAAFRTIRTMRDRKAARGWFLRIVSNRCIGSLRKQAVRPPLTELTPELADPHCVAEETGQRLALHQALDAMSAADRNVILLREYLDLPYEDMATALDIPVGTVRSRLSEARRRLAQRLAKEGTP